MQIFPVKIGEIDATTLCDTNVNMSCMSYGCYMKLEDLLSLRSVPTISVHSGTEHDLCPPD